MPTTSGAIGVPAFGGRVANVGSDVYAETSDYLSATIERIGNRGLIMLPDLIGMQVTAFVMLYASLLVSALVILQQRTS